MQVVSAHLNDATIFARRWQNSTMAVPWPAAPELCVLIEEVPQRPRHASYLNPEALPFGSWLPILLGKCLATASASV